VTAIALTVGLVAALILLLLSVPLRLSLRAASDPPVLDLAVGWPAGWLPDIHLGARRPRAPKAPPRRDAALQGGGAERRRRALMALPRLLSGVVGALRVERLSLRGRFGAGDPALTGQIYGACAPLVFGTAGLPRLDLRVEPDFHRPCLSGEALAVLRLRPIRLALPALRFLWACYGPRR
jgi:hypothetical protein